MNNIRTCVREIVNKEIIYAYVMTMEKFKYSCYNN